jgi:hypothetical protein
MMCIFLPKTFVKQGVTPAFGLLISCLLCCSFVAYDWPILRVISAFFSSSFCVVAEFSIEEDTQNIRRFEPIAP